MLRFYFVYLHCCCFFFCCVASIPLGLVLQGVLQLSKHQKSSQVQCTEHNQIVNPCSHNKLELGVTLQNVCLERGVNIGLYVCPDASPLTSITAQVKRPSLLEVNTSVWKVGLPPRRIQQLCFCQMLKRVNRYKNRLEVVPVITATYHTC